MDKGGFRILQFLGDVAGQTEIRILVYRAGDQARDIGHGTEDLGKGV